MEGKPPTYEELVELTRLQARQIEQLRAEVERLKAELEQSRRAGKRQAAPFSKGSPKADPGRPGRKPGHPPSHRAAPSPEQVDRTINVPLPPDCPECRTPLGEAPVTIHDQYQIDLPQPKPVITRFRVPVTRCPACLRRVQGRHPEQTSNALGSAAVQFGPRLLGFAADLKHRLGVSYRKCSSVLLTLTGVVVASAALVRSGHRLRKLAQPSYDRLVEAAKTSAVQHVDETGWKIGGRSAWLWVFADEHATLYRIRKSRAHDVVVEVLGEEFAGVLVSDCFLAYDPLPFAKQKCLAHLLKSCREIEAAKTKGAVRFSRRVAALLRRAMALKRRRGKIGDHGYAVLRGKVHAELDRMLAGTYTDPDNARLAKRLRKQREHLLRFLDHDGVDATNNLAEREVRPAVIARKLSAGNRTEAGAKTHAVLASVLRTLSRQGRPILDGLMGLLRHGSGGLLEFDHVRPPDRRMSFHDELRNRLRLIPLGQPAAPWRPIVSQAVGGLTEVGFASQSDLLLVVSSQGRGLFDGRSGERIARDPAPPDDGWYDEVRLTASGIGPVGDQLIRLAGLHGGGLSACTEDGWGITRIAPDWPLESIVLDPPGSSVLYQGHDRGCIRIAEGFGMRAFGFSETGLSLVVASSDHVELWCRSESSKTR